MVSDPLDHPVHTYTHIHTCVDLNNLGGGGGGGPYIFKSIIMYFPEGRTDQNYREHL